MRQSGSFDKSGPGAGRQLSGGAPVLGGRTGLGKWLRCRVAARFQGAGPMSGRGPVSGAGPAEPQTLGTSLFGNLRVRAASSVINPFDPPVTRGPDGKPIDPKNDPKSKEPLRKRKDREDRQSRRPGGKALICSNCGTILQVRPIRVKHQPSWMLPRETTQPQTATQRKTPRCPFAVRARRWGPMGGRSILNQDSNGLQLGKRVFEVTLLMESGLTQKVHLGHGCRPTTSAARSASSAIDSPLLRSRKILLPK